MNSRIYFLSVALLFSLKTQAQYSDRAIPTTMTYLLTRPDARSSGMGDVGAATSPDSYSIYANPSKIVFADAQSEAGLSYVPLMSNLVKDVSLVNFSGYRKTSEKTAFGVSIYYLSYGQVNLTDDLGNPIQNYYPVEYTADLTYARKMGEGFSMALSGRFLHSNTRFEKTNSNLVAAPASAFATDVSVYFEKPSSGKLADGKWSFGAMISNIGTKVHYQGSRSEFLPTNLKLGAAFSFHLQGSMQKLTLSADINKLLVPTPPVYDSNGEILDGRDPDRSVVSALFTSFADAPGGFSEELSEISLGTGIEYSYNNNFLLRTGYFHENPDKGNRQHFTLGTGLRYRDFGFDLAYIIPTANRFVLKNNVKFSISYRIK
jgi:hypothetical protein